MIELCRRLLDDLPNGAAFVVDRELHYVLAGGQALKAAGLSAIDVQGKSVHDIVPPHLAGQAQTDYLAALEGKPFHTRHSVGDREFVTHGVPLHADDGTVIAALAVSYDVTDTPSAPQPVATARELALAELNRRKDVFLATLAHELRNFLSPINSGLEVLRLGSLDRDQSESIFNLFDRQVRQMSRLVEDLVDVARIAEGKLGLEPASISVQDAVDLAVESSRPLLVARGYELVVAVAAPEERVWADPGRLNQILTNLLNNAAKFTRAAGLVEVGAREVGDFVEFQVRDNGPGIAKKHLASVFELFKQLDSTRPVEGHAGLGIGLTLVKVLTELHGGFVEVHSDGLGRGSVFSVSLPRRRTPAEH